MKKNLEQKRLLKKQLIYAKFDLYRHGNILLLRQIEIQTLQRTGVNYF